jgi:hypothetical protein
VSGSFLCSSLLLAAFSSGMEGTMLQRQPPPSDPRMQDQAAIHPITEESSSNDPTSSAKSDKSQTSTSNGLVSTGDTNAVNRSKLLVYLALSVAAGVVGAMTYVLTSNEETAKFEREVRSRERQSNAFLSPNWTDTVTHSSVLSSFRIQVMSLPTQIRTLHTSFRRSIRSRLPLRRPPYPRIWCGRT